MIFYKLYIIIFSVISAQKYWNLKICQIQGVARNYHSEYHRTEESIEESIETPIEEPIYYPLNIFSLQLFRF